MKYHCVLQHGEEDCGAAAVATIAKHYGRTWSINRIREAIGTGQLGTSLLGLRRGCEILGFNARAVKAPQEILEDINQVPLPAIIHWKGYHWVVLYGKRGKNYVIADPGVGLRYLSQQKLLEGWVNGVMLLIEPDPVRFEAQPNEKISGLRRFFAPALNYRGILAQAVLINLVLGLLALTAPFLIQILTDDVLVRRDEQLLTTVVIAVVVMNIFSHTLELVQSNLIIHFSERLELGLILEFCRAILRLPLTYYESRRSGDIVSRLGDIQQINQLVLQVIIGLPSQLFIALVSLVLMLLYSWQLTIFALGIAVSMTSTTIIFLPRLKTKFRELLVAEGENQGVLIETFKGAITLKTTLGAPDFWGEFQSRFGRLSNVGFRTLQIAVINRVFSNLVSKIGSIILLWLGSQLVFANSLSIGQLLAFHTMSVNFNNFVSLVIRFVDEFVRVTAVAQRLAEVIEATPENQDNTNKPFAVIPGNADIICTNLNFHHPGRVDLLSNFDLVIPGGKSVALIGKSGCGKSTITKILAGLYTAKSGNIRIGIYNLQDLSLDCLRQQIVLVPQEAHFWSRSIMENFRIGSPYISFEKIVTACQITGADEFISKLPDKYQTILGEFGANISGGQRQRLAIARAIVKDPAVLILDESTSSLDPSSEAEILNKLLFYRQEKTTILISHRPRVIERSDWVIFLENGSLKIQGTVEELRAIPGNHLDFLNP